MARCAACSPTRRAASKFPVVVVIHENRGLNPYIEDVARRLAVAGFMALAPDAIWPLGGYPNVDKYGAEADEKALEMQKQLDGAKDRRRFHRRGGIPVKASAVHRQAWRGRLLLWRWPGEHVGGAHAAARRGRTLLRRAPATADVPKIKGGVLLNFADSDPNIPGVGPLTKKRSRLMTSSTKRTSIPKPITAFTTIRRRVMTRPPPNSPGSAPWIISTRR